MALSVATVNSLLTLSCLAGLGLSIYSYVIELQLENDGSYTPMCDIDENISCSKAFLSEYGKGFGLFGEDSPFNKPNSLFGIFFYSLIATLVQVNFKYTVLISSFGIGISNVASIYFAYILYAKLQNLCLICVSIYVVNFVNLILIQLKSSVLSDCESLEKSIDEPQMEAKIAKKEDEDGSDEDNEDKKSK